MANSRAKTRWSSSAPAAGWETLPCNWQITPVHGSGIGREKDRAATLKAGASSFVDPDHEPLPNLTDTTLVLDAVGGTLARSVAAALASSGRFVSIVDPAAAELVGSRGTFFVVEPDRDGLNEIARRVDDGSLSPALGQQADLSGAPKLLEAKELGRVTGKVSINVH